VAALDRALALAEREHAAVRVAEHLDLDVPRGRHELLDVDAAVAEGRLGLGARGAERVFEVVRARDEPHPFPPPPAERLEEHGKPSSAAAARSVREPDRAVGARDERDTRRAHRLLRAHLVAHLLDDAAAGRRRRGRVLARAHERGVLGEEAVARMDRSQPVVSAAATTFEIRR
jgi:hypothetical protein